MKPFMGEQYLLESEFARRLYHDFAAQQPIFDYHNHVSAKEIFEDKPAQNITQLWLGADHYKWRLMRANGISERFITGDATDHDKFVAFAETLPYAIGNPVYHWSHLELQRYFEIHTPLSGETAEAIWAQANERIAQGGFTPRELLRRANVTALCTTEDPADDLTYHARLKNDATFPIQILPAFRPEKAGEIWRGAAWREYLERLSKASGVAITSFATFKRALSGRMDAFAAHGCRASDYGTERMPFSRASERTVEAVFARGLSGEAISEEDVAQFQTELLLWLAEEYARRNWVMELHIGPVRAKNTRMTSLCGKDAGFDSVSDHAVSDPIGAFLDELNTNDCLPKTILFSLNHKDNLVLMSLAGDFQNERYPGYMQVGSAWWFNDHRDGIVEQMRLLSTQGLLGRSLGMTTDSRSFLSFARHDYFRRVLCNLIAGWVEAGEYPADPALLERLICDLSGKNAARYFGVV